MRRHGKRHGHRIAVGALALLAACAVASPAPQASRRLFDGKTLKGWEGNLAVFRVENGAITAGGPSQPIPRNEFLCTTERFSDFILTLEFRVEGSQANAGVQFRTERIPNHHEVSGYQADIGEGYWGSLYDESRRNRILAQADPAVIAAVLKREGWNTYEIHCEGPRIRLKLNGRQTVDYVETDDSIPREGVIGLQIHSGPPMQVWYRNIRIRPLRPR